MADPAAVGRHKIQTIEYDAQFALVQSDVVAGTGHYYVDRLRGLLHVPAGPPRPHPVLVLVPGRHDNCRVAGRDLGFVGTFVWPCPDAAPAVEDLPSWRGFGYIGQVLASHGYVVATINTNGTNAHGVVGGDAAREQLIHETLRLLQQWHAGPRSLPDGVGDALVGKVDLGRIGLLGHSRGGAAVGRFLRNEQTRRDGRQWPGVRGVVQVAAVDAATGDPAPGGVPFATLLGGCDADTGASGTAMWERGRTFAHAPRVQWVIAGANHNFFNSEWWDEWAPPAPPPLGTGDNPSCAPGEPTNIRLAPKDQQAITVRLVSSFFRTYVGREPELHHLVAAQAALPRAACPSGRVGDGRPVSCGRLLQTAFLSAGGDRVDLVRPGSGLQLPATGMAHTAACSPEAGTPCPEQANASVAPQTTISWTGAGTVRLAGHLDLRSASAIRIRAAMNPGSSSGPRLAVQLRMTDANNRKVQVPLTHYTTVLDRPHLGGGTPYNGRARDGYLNLTLGGARVPISAFGKLDLGRIRRVDLVLAGTGSMQLDEVVLDRQ